MLINIPSQRQVCYSSVRERVRERGGKKGKEGKRLEGPIEQVSAPDKCSLCRGNRNRAFCSRRNYANGLRTRSFSLFIFISNPRAPERLRQPLPQGHLGTLMGPNKRTGNSTEHPPPVSKATAKLQVHPKTFWGTLPSPLCSAPLPVLHPWNEASPQLWKFPSPHSKCRDFAGTGNQ